MSSSEWKKCKLRDLTIKITKGTTPTTIGHKFVETGVNYIKAESILLDGRIDPSKFGFISLQTHEKLSRSQLEENDILFSMAGMVLGKSAVVKKDFLPANTNQALAIIRLKQEIVDPQFISYFMKQESFFNYVNYSTGQSAQPNINLEEIGDLEINLPPLSTQKWITGILSSLDEKIELNRQTNATLETIAQAIFKEWLNDFNFPGADGEMVESEMGLIPKGWWVGKLGDISKKITKGTTPTTFGDDFVDQGLRFLRVDCIKDDLGIDESKSLFITPDTHNKLKRSQLALNDILITIAGSIGRIGIVSERILPANLNQAIGLIRINEKIVPVNYVYYFLKQQSIKDRLLSGVTQSVQANISLQDLSNLKIIIPPITLLESFNNITQKTRDHIEILTEQLSSLIGLRDILLPKLIKGELEI